MKHGMRLMMGCSEETGMPDFRYYMEHKLGPDTDIAIVCDGGFPGGYAQKGFYTTTIHIPAGKDIVDFAGGTVHNAIPDTAVITVKGVTLEAAQAALKGADRVRKRPGVIFGSDGLEGCEHAVFEILSNAIDEAREGHGDLITVTRYEDKSIEVEDFGRGCPVDWNEAEGRWNWELVFCELYAGGKYKEDGGDNYEYSLGLNGLGSCATQYASEYFDAVIHRDGFEYTLHFEKGEITEDKETFLHKTPWSGKKTGSKFRWKPDLEVFTDINIPVEYYTDVMKRQAVVNAGVTFRFKNETEPGKFETTEYVYENGIQDYVKELAGETKEKVDMIHAAVVRHGLDIAELKKAQ